MNVDALPKNKLQGVHSTKRKASAWLTQIRACGLLGAWQIMNLSNMRIIWIVPNACFPSVQSWSVLNVTLIQSGYTSGGHYVPTLYSDRWSYKTTSKATKATTTTTEMVASFLTRTCPCFLAAVEQYKAQEAIGYSMLQGNVLWKL